MPGEGAQQAKIDAAKAKTKVPAAAAKAEKAEAKITPAVAVNKATASTKATQGAQTPATRAAASAANKLADDYLEAQKTPGYKGVGSNFYEPPIKIIPKVVVEEDGPGPGPGGPGPTPVTSNPVETVVGSTGLVDGVNYKEVYLEEIKRLVLSLVSNAKSLLIRYNFSGIDRVPESYLDFDREAKTETLSSSFSRPESPFTLEQADLQDKFSIDLNEINNLISDLSNSAEKSKYFGSMRGGTFLPREVKLLRNGSVGYDMRLEFTSISNQDFVIKCYEVS
jgi:hypothetical protein